MVKPVLKGSLRIFLGNCWLPACIYNQKTLVDFTRFNVQIQMLCEKHRFPKFAKTVFPIVPAKLYVASQVAEQTF